MGIERVMRVTGAWMRVDERSRSWMSTSDRASMSGVEGSPRSLRRRRLAWSRAQSSCSLRVLKGGLKERRG